MKYLKSKLPEILIFAACAAVFYTVIALHRLPTDAVLYALLLTLLILVPFFIYKAVKIRRKCRQLKQLTENGEVILEDSSLPETADPLELCYQELIRQIDSEKHAAASRFAASRTDAEDYYTLWAHQIKTPISALQLLLCREDGENRRECEAELFKIEQYVEMVLSYLRLESDSSDYVFREYRVDDILKQAIKKFSKQFILKKLPLDFKETGISAVTDEKWLRFMIEQVISNALKYTVSGGISVYGIDNAVYIKDSGIGIAAEDIPRVFEKGYTGYNGRTDRKSSGLGLYLSKKIAEQLGHEISITSKPGVGTTVKIDLSRHKLGIE